MVTDPIHVSQLMFEAQGQLEHEGQKEESEVSGSQDDLVTNSESEHVTPVPEVTLDEVQVDRHDATIQNAIRIRNNLVDVIFSPLLSAEVRASAQLPRNKRGSEYARKALVGNSFCCQVVAWQLGHCLFAEGLLLRRPSLEELASGRCLELAVRLEKEVHVQPHEAEARRSQERARAEPGRALARRLANLSDHRGSDVRVTLETSLRPGGWPRAETPAHWWRWKVAFAMRWQLDKEHINILELRAALATLRWRTRQRRFQGKRVIHLLDSAVVIGVLTKRRSSNVFCGIW